MNLYPAAITLLQWSVIKDSLLERNADSRRTTDSIDQTMHTFCDFRPLYSTVQSGCNRVARTSLNRIHRLLITGPRYKSRCSANQ